MSEFVLPSSTFTSEEAAATYDGFSFWASPFVSFLTENFALHEGIAVLDLACGTGFSLLAVAERCGRSCRVTGVDMWLEALDIARAKLADRDLPNVSIAAADGALLPFRDQKFDAITCNLGINNFADPPAVLAECSRVLKPGGRIGITTNASGHMREFYAVFREVLEKMHPEYLDNLADNEAHRGTRASHSATLEKAGFRVVKAVEDTLTLRYADGTDLLNSLLIQLGFLDGWRKVVGPDDEGEVFEEIVHRLDKIAAARGELAMTTPMLYLEGAKS